MRDEAGVSAGLPGRRLIIRTFLSMATCAGLDTLLVDVRDQALLSSIYASKSLSIRTLTVWSTSRHTGKKDFGVNQVAE
jgi:hypothetical protein